MSTTADFGLHALLTLLVWAGALTECTLCYPKPGQTLSFPEAVLENPTQGEGGGSTNRCPWGLKLRRCPCWDREPWGGTVCSEKCPDEKHHFDSFGCIWHHGAEWWHNGLPPFCPLDEIPLLKRFLEILLHFNRLRGWTLVGFLGSGQQGLQMCRSTVREIKRMSI